MLPDQLALRRARSWLPDHVPRLPISRLDSDSSSTEIVEMTVPLLHLFVYGSLKRGYNNHDVYCRGVRSVETTNTPGKLYLLPTGYPVLVLAASRFLARGSRDPRADLEVQQRAATEVVSAFLSGSLALGRNRVHGELLTFGNAEGRLRAIDALEGFRAGQRCRYERVLVRVYSSCYQAEIPAWTYVAGPLALGRRPIYTGRWDRSLQAT
jgi:gamma-glutamylcyclotransferase (GGCT)/AIG2-like uncharacterized protein YtfP